MTALAPVAARWRVEIRVDDTWVPRSSARVDRVEAGEVLARLQVKQSAAEFRVVEA